MIEVAVAVVLLLVIVLGLVIIVASAAGVDRIWVWVVASVANTQLAARRENLPSARTPELGKARQ
jgi:hypothetical protein